MAATGTPTPNLGLRIPVGTDPASVDDINYNSNLLDTKLGPIGNDSVQDQIDGLSDQIATKSISLTVNSTNVSVNSLFVKRSGNIICINGWFRLTTAGKAGGNIFTLPSGAYPTDNVRIPCAISDQAYNAPSAFGYIVIDYQNGQMNLTTPSGNTKDAIYFTCSYAVAQ